MKRIQWVRVRLRGHVLQEAIIDKVDGEFCIHFENVMLSMDADGLRSLRDAATEALGE